MEAALLLFGVTAVLAVFAVVGRLNHQARVEALRKLARRLENGRVRVDTGWFASLDGATVRGQLDGHDVSVRFEVHGSGNQKRTKVQLSVGVSRPIGDLSIQRAGMLDRFGRWLGVVRHVESGNARADDKYILNGRPSALQGLFRHRGAEQALDRLFSAGYDQVELGPAGLQAEGDYAGKSTAGIALALGRMVALAKLCDRKEVKIRVLGEQIQLAWTGGGQDALCPYCRDGIDPEGLDLLACPSCNTVHHQECFDEAGGCTVFGCGERPRARATRVR